MHRPPSISPFPKSNQNDTVIIVEKDTSPQTTSGLQRFIPDHAVKPLITINASFIAFVVLYAYFAESESHASVSGSASSDDILTYALEILAVLLMGSTAILSWAKATNTNNQPKQEATNQEGLDRLAIDQEDVSTQFNIGVMCQEGLDVQQDLAMAFKYYTLAADRGHVGAQFNLGLMYEDGRGVQQDNAKAFKYYKLAADQGDADAQVNLGLMYQEGRGVQQDVVMAFKYYKLSADQGDADGRFNLGLMYQGGLGVQQDITEASQCYKLAADQGHKGAQIKLDRMNADPGIADEKFKLGLMYENVGTLQAWVKVAEFYQSAAAVGHAEAQRRLGWMYEEGSDVSQSDAKAVELCRRVADQGYAGAQYCLGKMYEEGLGVQQDDAEAAKYYKLAADQGHAGAQYCLGMMYAEGLGVQQDDAQAVRYYKLAVDQGNVDAEEELKDVLMIEFSQESSCY